MSTATLFVRVILVLVIVASIPMAIGIWYDLWKQHPPKDITPKE